MAQTRSSYTYNPDLPVRKWHQKTLQPTISLQNAPPASHGTPAPTKEDGEFGRAGFTIRTWVPVDEDEDVSVEELAEQEKQIDWWAKPGAPARPEVQAAVVTPATVMAVDDVPPVVAEGNGEPTEAENGIVNGSGHEEDFMQIDAPTVAENVETMHTQEQLLAAIPPSAAIPTHTPVSVVSPPSAPMESTQAIPPSPLNQISPQPVQHDDISMTEAAPSPVQVTNAQGSSASPQPMLTSPGPAPLPESPAPTSTAAAADPQNLPPHSPSPMHELVGPAKESPPPDPIGQANEVGAGLAMESPREQVEHITDSGNLSGAGGEIAGEGIVGGGDLDSSSKEEDGRVVGEGEEQLRDMGSLERSVNDLDTEVVHATD